LGTNASASRALAAAFVRKVIHVPYAENAQGPDAYDCWGLTRACQREVFGIDLPIIRTDNIREVIAAFTDHALADSWKVSPIAMHGALVGLSSAKHLHHIGTWLDLDGGVLLHTVQTSGVLVQDSNELRINGWHTLRFYRPPLEAA